MGNINSPIRIVELTKFCKKREVKKYIRNQKNLHLDIYDDLSIIEVMVNRITSDVEFRKRQSAISAVALFMKKVGIVNLVKFFPNCVPYMKLSFRKSGVGIR